MGNEWDKLILSSVDKPEEEIETDSKNLSQTNKVKMNEKYFVSPEYAKDKFCHYIQKNCIAVKCNFWLKGRVDYLKTWDGKTGGNPVLVKKIEQKKYKLERILFAWDDKQTLVARWIKKQKRRKGYISSL